jgi:hypothetical protein
VGIVSATGRAAGRSTATGIMRLKSGFAMTHLLVAAESARKAYELEQAKADEWFDGMMRLVPVSVVMSGAALEANANELIQNLVDGTNDLPVTAQQKVGLITLKEDRSGNAKKRYKRLAELADKRADFGSEDWRNAKLLIEFRNYFMHFKPSWSDDDIDNDDLVGRLRKKIPVVRGYETNFLFPHGLMTYGCARWAVQTVLDVSAGFAKALGVKDQFAVPALDFTLP